MEKLSDYFVRRMSSKKLSFCRRGEANINKLTFQQTKAVTTAPHNIDIISTIAGISVLNVATESELSVSSSDLNNELKNRDTAFGNAYYYGGDSEVLRAKCGGKKNGAIKKCKNACEEAYTSACEELNCYRKLKKKTKKLCKVFCIDEFS